MCFFIKKKKKNYTETGETLDIHWLMTVSWCDKVWAHHGEQKMIQISCALFNVKCILKKNELYK